MQKLNRYYEAKYYILVIDGLCRFEIQLKIDLVNTSDGVMNF